MEKSAENRMDPVLYKQIYDLDRTGISIHYYTQRGEYTPPHWHSAIEMHYALNGTGEIIIGKQRHALVSGEFLLVDSNMIHHTQCARISMGIAVYVDRAFLKKYVPDIELLHLECSRETLEREKLEDYLKICEMMKELPRMYILHPQGWKMKCEAIVMEVLFLLLNCFSVREMKPEDTRDIRVRERLDEINAYVKKHYKEPVSLENIASELGLSREYFCRFFRQHMGITYARHVNLVRLVHIYDDILHTQDNITVIAEKHGFSNYRLFTKMFREIYGCMPASLRKG